MEYITLGRTGLRVSVMGLGCGGLSCLGQSTGKSEDESINLVRKALDFGINFIDTAETYRTERIVGNALKGLRREDVVLSTKAPMYRDNKLITADDLVQAAENSLRKLNTDYLDIYHFHAVEEKEYQYVAEELVPIQLRLRDEGKIRFLGITERFMADPTHMMLKRAIQDDCWDVVCVGFNLLNQTARTEVLTTTIQKNIGVLGMYAVRRALSNIENLKIAFSMLAQTGVVDGTIVEDDHPLGFLFHEKGAVSLTDAAYRYCSHEPGIHVVLFSTGSMEHLQANVTSLLSPPLPHEDLIKIKELFGKVNHFSGHW
ncbi:MAG: aldo/keto reductase [Nitrospinae bacterium]|nr:aldo/keto reductase [Nitrospinota bacterium]